jgi:uncharacterized membrane protein
VSRSVPSITAGKALASGQPEAKTARGLLDERLARGDIDLDEYQLRRQALEQHVPTGV